MRMRERVLFAQQQGLGHGCSCCWWDALRLVGSIIDDSGGVLYRTHTHTPTPPFPQSAHTHNNTIQSMRKRQKKAPGYSHIRMNSQELQGQELWHQQAVRGNAQVLQSEIHKWYFAFYLLTYYKTKRISPTSCFSYSLLCVYIFYFIRIFIFILILCFESCSSQKKNKMENKN